jgi:hypothetical protein
MAAMTTKFVEIVQAYESSKSARGAERQAVESVFDGIRQRLFEAWSLRRAFLTLPGEARLEDDGVAFRANVLTLHVPRPHDVHRLTALGTIDRDGAARGKEALDVPVALRARVEGGKVVVSSDYSSEDVLVDGPGDREAIDQLLEKMHEGIKAYVTAKGAGR